jgi:hypothetical protein
MADEAFALSPISARSAPPSEADYDAIREAFMETARGRWFLGEYAKRNRNADTRMVLDAVARIEDTIAAQRQPPPPDNRLPEALAAIRGAIDRAEDKATRAVDGSALEESLTPIRKGARIIKEISWRWREIGADGRICDLIDSQIAAIEAGCGRIASHDPRAALREAFEEIRAEIEAFRESSVAAPVAAEPQAATVVVPFPPPAEHAFAASAHRRDEAPRALAEVAAPQRPAEAIADTTEAAIAADTRADAEADAQDEAVLDLVAAEMAAPDMSELDDFPIVEPEEAHITPPPPPPEPVTIPRAIEPRSEPRNEPRIEPRIEPRNETRSEPRIVAPLLQVSQQATPAAAIEPLIRPTPAPEPSLGSTILATGLVARREPAADPLAPIRRMSQAEKIAFFS